MLERISRTLSTPRKSAVLISWKSLSRQPSTSFRMRAMVVFPQPDGPDRRTAWGMRLLLIIPSRILTAAS